MSHFYHKPELALRRAQELESIKQSDASLSLLHDVLSSRRHRTWSPTYEQIMMFYLELCLKLHKSREAKDGLHQYRNLSQSQAPGSLEKVIRFLMDSAEKKCIEAKANADATAAAAEEATSASAAAESTDDGTGDSAFGSSPEAILLSTMSTDPNKTQRDSTLFLPSLKFLWETYRAVLDILKSNSKLEHVYHAAALGALRFCRTYKRRTEFRRLCDMLRMHLGNLQKYGSITAITSALDIENKQNSKVRGWEGWTNDAIELHLKTRFEQLETASVLHLYTEGFRTVEDIYNILQISHARRKQIPNSPPPKAKLMAAYYEKLTTLFWVSENYLFHAFAWYKYYSLCKEYNRSMSDEMKQMQASAVLLATLCIPTLPTPGGDKKNAGNDVFGQKQQQHGITSTVEDDIAKEKTARMATLLGFHTRHPTREALLVEIRSPKNSIMESVPPYLRELYNLLEENTDPLAMVDKAKPLLEQLKKEVGSTTSRDDDEEKKIEHEDVKDNTLGRYVKPLTNVLLLKLVLNLSVAYHTVSMDHLRNLTSGLDVTFEQVEKSIVLFTQTKTLSVKIDHRAGCLRFGDAQLESNDMRYQLSILAKELQNVCDNIVDKASTDSKAVDEQMRIDLYSTVRANSKAEHDAILERKDTIEKRKEAAEILAQQKINDELRRKAELDAKKKQEEAERRVREQRLRDIEKRKKIEDEMKEREKKKYLDALGRDTENMTKEELKEIDTEALAKEHADKANKERQEAERKTKEAAKKLDYLVRAVRIEELPLIQKKYEEKIQKDRERYEADVIEKAKRAKEQWESDVKEKEQLEAHTVFAYMDEFQSMIMEGRQAKHEEACKEADAKAEIEAEKGKIARARKRKEDEIQRQKDEEARKKHEEEERKAEEERARKEEERRKKAAEEEKLRQAELARMKEERDRKEKERQQAMQSRGGGPPSRDFDSAAAPSSSGGGSKYVPPSRRNRGGGSSYDDRGNGGGGYGSRGGGYGGGRYDGGSGRRDDRMGGGSGGGGSYNRRDGDRRGGYGDRRDDRGGSNRAGSRW